MPSPWSIRIDAYSKTPKYQQIIHSILEGIRDGTLRQGDKLPSVNHLLIEFDISRDTIVRAYDQLKSTQIIDSIPGKGYYVMTEKVAHSARVLLMFNKLSAHKKIIYDAFTTTLGEEVSIDFFVYHNDFKLFKTFLEERMNNPYTHYVIIPHFLEGGENAVEIIRQIPEKKLIILDKNLKGLTGDYGAVFQDFENDLYQALTDSLDALRKYQQINLVFPPYSYHPEEIKQGFIRFCTEYAFPYQVISNIDIWQPSAHHAFVNLMEDDLVTIIKKSKTAGYVVGETIGILSYNETPLKEILLNGISTISTDFKELGITAANMILENNRYKTKNSFRTILRNSL